MVIYRLELCSSELRSFCTVMRCLDPELMKKYLEGKSSTDHGVKNNPAAPKIHLKSVILFPCDHFRSSIARTPASCFQLLLYQSLLICLDTFLSLLLEICRNISLYEYVLILFLGNLRVCIRKAKINNLDVLLVIQKHVFRLKIAMDDAESVEIVDPIDDLVEEAAGLLFGQSG